MSIPSITITPDDRDVTLTAQRDRVTIIVRAPSLRRLTEPGLRELLRSSNLPVRILDTQAVMEMIGPQVETLPIKDSIRELVTQQCADNDPSALLGHFAIVDMQYGTRLSQSFLDSMANLYRDNPVVMSLVDEVESLLRLDEQVGR